MRDLVDIVEVGTSLVFAGKGRRNAGMNPNLVDSCTDMLNPVQISARDTDPRGLNKGSVGRSPYGAGTSIPSGLFPLFHRGKTVRKFAASWGVSKPGEGTSLTVATPARCPP
jgi:hypothetical protein